MVTVREVCDSNKDPIQLNGDIVDKDFSYLGSVISSGKVAEEIDSRIA